ncbi:MAG: acyl-CoA dehydratase activase-related protein [Eggerthellaceae bacterium]|nr:acyl-CoA dehydratase activase-related protein [Eggerthellaceae bacterium]
MATPLRRFAKTYSDVLTIGIPRSLLYYRYGTLWRSFFEAIGRKAVVSRETDRLLLETGERLSIDECCLASKIYLGHVESLRGACDAVFVPCYASGNPRSGFCTKFQSAPDLVANTFRDTDLRLMTLLVEDASNPHKTRGAFLKLAEQMDVPAATARRAWKLAERAQNARNAERAAAQEKTLRLLEEYRNVVAQDPSGSEKEPLAILLAAHPYIAHDRYLCGTVVDALEGMGATVLYADETRHDRAFHASLDFSETMPWAPNREIIGSILMLQKHLDGIVLVSAFPCGPDSMTDDAVMRCVHGTPILNLMIDAQSGTAGIETRLESFVDIIRFHQGKQREAGRRRKGAEHEG